MASCPDERFGPFPKGHIMTKPTSTRVSARAAVVAMSTLALLGVAAPSYAATAKAPTKVHAKVATKVTKKKTKKTKKHSTTPKMTTAKPAAAPTTVKK